MKRNITSVLKNAFVFKILLLLIYLFKQMDIINHTLHNESTFFAFKNRQYSYNNSKDLIYYGSNKTLATRFNHPEMLEKYSSPDHTSLRKRFPRFIGIGTSRSGTTALRMFLSRHPEIAMADSYETTFFHEDNKYELGLEVYLDKMSYSTKSQISYEKSPQYFWDPLVPGRIHSFDPSVKLLLTVRNPVYRCVSHYLTFCNRGRYWLPFQYYVLDPQGNVKYSTDVRDPVGVSMYSEYLDRWLRHFPRDQIHIVDGDKLISNPVQELEKIENFLNITHFLTRDKFHLDEDKGFYCFRLGASGNETCLNRGRVKPDSDIVSILEDYHKTLPEPNPAAARHISNKTVAETLLRLQTFFRPYNVRFHELTGQTFDWD